ncbi:carbohydrate ABC transporter permease [Litorihabitans aurantiacus]|uniref:Glycerol-3-phosphate ABC transporter permease n=1 Tax=Litorihabitans aurantiacus TaxID=1930061 RepID=A0AA37URN5_9MICO|nr:sugar ABC transporter permease [Litorihabitans aurantiacus]GMA30320.1 glycerol-3-phosphate ABC transporter permease [Litorihabitans aurantiacus]
MSAGTLARESARSRRTPDRLAPERRTPGSRARRRHESAFGYGMIAIAALAIALFTLGPILVSLGLSFFSWDVISPPEFVGLDNYAQMAGDDRVVRSFGTTLLLAFAIVVLQVAIGLLLALLVQQRTRTFTRSVFRTVYYLPALASAAAVSIFMSYLFNERFGVVNYYLRLLGGSNVPWLTSEGGAIVTIVMVAVWQSIGFTFILFVAALTSVPRDVVEASEIDGAGPVRRLTSITLPLISPTVFFACVIGLINSMQLFDQPFILTQGGPGTATTTVTMVIYQTAFQNLQFGYGSAISMVLFAALLLLTGVQFVLSRKLVFYS